jgi:hypothetical protein
MQRALYLNRAFISAVPAVRSIRQNQFIDFKHYNMPENQSAPWRAARMTTNWQFAVPQPGWQLYDFSRKIQLLRPAVRTDDRLAG